MCDSSPVRARASEDRASAGYDVIYSRATRSKVLRVSRRLDKISKADPLKASDVGVHKDV